MAEYRFYQLDADDHIVAGMTHAAHHGLIQTSTAHAADRS